MIDMYTTIYIILYNMRIYLHICVYLFVYVYEYTYVYKYTYAGMYNGIRVQYKIPSCIIIMLLIR